MDNTNGVKLKTKNAPNINTLNGFGAEWDPHFWVSFNTRHGIGEADWQLVTDRIRNMRLQYIRVMVLPEWYEPVNDNIDPLKTDWESFDFTTEPVLSLIRQLKFAQEQNITVNLTFWGADNRIPSWLAFPGVESWISAPADIEEWAENVSVLLQYLINKEGLDCIKEITLYNEPDWAYYNSNNEVDFNHYAAMIRCVRARLQRDGLLEKVRMNISDDAQNPEWLLKVLQELGDQGDMFNSHSYIFNNTDSNDKIYSWYRKLAGDKERYAPGKPYVFGEFGTNNIIDGYHQYDIGTYERGLYYARLAVNFLNAGGAGMCAWVLFDQYYYDGPSESAKMNLGLWGFKDEGWSVRPIYHSWALINRYTRIGSEVYTVFSEDPDIVAIAFRSPQGEWTFLVANSALSEKELTIINENKPDMKLNRYAYTRQTLPSDDSIITSDGILELQESILNVDIGPESFLMLTELK